MSYRAGHAPLSSNGYAWLAAIADPAANGRIPAHEIAANEVPALIDAAWAHGVLPAAARHLKNALRGSTARSTDPLTAQSLDELDQRLVLVTGQGLLLMSYERRIAAAIADQALQAAIVKGPVFARRLYQYRSDRSFTDIDILAAPASLDATGEILRQLGFVQAPPANRPGMEPDEFKWLLPGNDVVLVEVQTSLVHSTGPGEPRLCYADLVAAGDGDPEDATALLLVAAVHGVLGHQFERLQPAVDLLQAVREVAGPISRTRLARVAAITGTTAALQTALDVVSRLFAEHEAARLADMMPPRRWRRLRRMLLSPALVLRSQASGADRDSWRRRAVRKMVRRERSGEANQA